MKRKIIFFFIIASIILSFSCYNEIISIPNVTIEVNERDSILNMGIITEESMHKTKFVEWHIKSTSGLPIKIERIESSCECIITEFEYEGLLKNKAIIRAYYDYDRNISGVFFREIEVYGNFASPLYLDLQGEFINVK